MQKIFLPQKTFIETYKDYINSGHWIRMSYRGLGSFFDMRNEIKYYNRDICHPFSIDRNDKPELMLPGEAARHVLMHHYPIGFTQSHQYNDTRIPAPILFNGASKLDSAIYIDIKSCYCQMYKRLWLDTMYPSLSGTMPLRPIAEFFGKYGQYDANKLFAKKARNAITGLLYSSRVMFYNGTRYFSKRVFGNLFNPLVWYTINLALHELANRAIDYGAIYVATDGFIFPEKTNYNKFINLLDWLDLEFRAISGKCRILRFGAYSIRGHALRDDETQKTTELYKSALVEKLRLYNHDIPNPREKMVAHAVSLRQRLWSKPINNIIKCSDISTLDKWRRLK